MNGYWGCEEFRLGVESEASCILKWKVGRSIDLESKRWGALRSYE